MSQTKKIKFQLIFILLLVCFSMFGCKNETPVEDIYFNLNSSEQIVLIVGQTLEMDDYVVVKPAYATNKKYTITSYNEEVVKVENNKLIALKEDQAVIKVTSNDNPLKESIMTVVVKATQEQLSAPLNFEYNSQTQTFSFDPVLYASSYTLKINGEAFELGNSTTFNMSSYSGAKVDSLIVAQVKANAPAYSYALQTSNYTNEYKIYQAGQVSNLQVTGGIVSFDKSASRHNIYLNGTLFAENITTNYFSLKNLDALYAGMTLNVEVEAIVSDEVKQQYGSDVLCFNSPKKSVNVNVLDVPNLNISGTSIGWQNVSHAHGYSIWVDGVKKTETKNNYFDLQNLDNFDNLISVDNVHTIKVVPLLAETSINLGQTTKESSINVQRLASVEVDCLGTNLIWDKIDNSSVYAIKLNGEDVNLQTSTDLSIFSMKGYAAGEYSFEITAIAQVEPSVDNVYYLSSKTTTKNFAKHESLTAVIENYVLKIANLNYGNVKLDFDVDEFDTSFVGQGDVTSFDLSNHQFETGTHSIILTRLGNENFIDSDEIKIEFVQLEKIENITISNGVVSVVRSDINKNAIIKLETSGENLVQPIVVDNTGYQYNSVDVNGKDYISAGTYVTKVYVYGDGSSTFSYREAGEIVACSQTDFEVLSAPNNFVVDKENAMLTFNETSNKYKLYISNVTPKELNTNSCTIDLNSGSVSCAVQSIGDGVKTLNSILSEDITITRLEMPTLMYDNADNIISKIDVDNAESYVFTHNKEVITDYEFGIDEIVLADEETGNVFTLTAIAKAGENNNFYLNSFPFELTLNYISNEATIEIDGLDNTLIISPKNHTEEFDLVVEFTLSDGGQTFTTKVDDETNKKVISNGQSGEEVVLTYSYIGGKYYIDIIDENYNAIINSMNNEFLVRVKFVKSSTGNDELINSEYCESATLNLIRIDGTTTITVNEENQIVLTNEHTQEFGLVGVVMTSSTFGYIVESNGEGQLVCNKYISDETIGTIENPVALNYSYSYNRTEGKSYYYIDILNEEKESIIPGLSSNFAVKVKYSFLHNGVESDLDSDYSLEKTISVQPVANVARDGQNLKITNVKETYTYLNYSLLINNTYSLLLDDTAISENGYILFDVDYIYSHTPANILQNVNIIEVVVRNVETSEDDPVLSMKGGKILISKTQTVVLSNYKYNNNEDGNNNNSTVVQFNTYDTTYQKQYIVEFYSAQIKLYTMICVDSDAIGGVVSFNMDDISELADVVGLINISANVQTVGDYVQDEDVVYVFNSVNSNQLNLDKINVPKNLNVSDSTLTFNGVANAVGYEIWEITGTGKTKLNSQLITSNSYDITNMSGEKQIVVKAISRTGSFTNSSDSEIITIHKVEKPTVSVVNGKFNIKLTLNLLTLMSNEKIQIIPEISNSSTSKVEIDLNNLDGEEIVLSGLNLVAEPYLFLSYNTQSLQSEHLTLKLKIKQTDAVDGIYYLNSDAVEMDCYGLFEPSNVKKTTSENNTVEMISWASSDKNILNDEALSVGYIFKIEYTEGGNTQTYYSDDTNLKYYDSTTQSYASYDSYIASTSAIFPAGYGLNDDGSLKVEFGAGSYKISVQAVPLSAIGGYNLCSSKYTSTCDFEIMQAPTLSVEQGKVVWDANAKADHYLVSIYQDGADTPFFVDTITSAEYDFTNTSLNDLAGVYRVVVKSISVRDDTLNSANSEELYIYRLPEASEVSVDDGHLILSATKFFAYAEIELVSLTSNTNFILTLDNSKNVQEYLKELSIENWKDFDNFDVINSASKFAISLDNEALKITDGGDYTINVKLIGNDGIIMFNDKTLNLGMISSSTVSTLSSMTATKLKPSAIEVSLGVVQFMPDGEYATISKDGVYTSIINLNYLFNSEPVSSAEFWNSTVVYKAVVTTSSAKIPIYAVDYYSFKTAVDNGKLSSSDYELLSGAYGLQACLKYNYIDGDDTKTLYFNVYENNMINLRDYEALYYYPITETMSNGVNKFTCGETYETIDLTLGGSFAIEIFMLGGDSYDNENNAVGYLSAQAKNTNTFIRYGVNQLSTNEGRVQFNNLIPLVDGKAIDHPVYKLVVTSLNSSSSQVFYIYHTSEEDARIVAKRHDAENFENAIYVQTEIDELTNVIIFDMSQYFVAGTYKVSIRTLAGLGTGEGNEQDYLLNAQAPTLEYTFQKLTDSEFVANNGILEFAQSYIIRDGNNIYYNNYEITLTDNATGTSYIYNLTKDSEGVTVDDAEHKVKYVLPKTMIFENGTLVINGGKEYSIKVRALATDNYILNGTYKVENESEVEFIFEKSLGISETVSDKLRIENGVLKWKVLDLTNFENTIIKVSFLDENFNTKNILISLGDLNRYEVDGVYKYHYYQFTDDKYNLETTGSAELVDKIIYNYETGAKEEYVKYTISAYTSGTTVGSRNILNSNYSSEVTTTRLSMVDTDGIKTTNGMLVWNAVENATSYEVTLIGDKNYTFTVYSTGLNFSLDDYLLDIGTYDIQIRAVGSKTISSMWTDKDGASGFVQLNKVDLTTVEIVDNNIVWSAVENADAYKIVFDYTDTTGTSQTINETIEETSFTTPSGISGIFTIRISAVSVGDGKEFNGQEIIFTSSNDAPVQVEKFEFDDETNRFIIDVKKANFLSGDKILIVYNFAEYVDNETTKETILINETISYMQTGKYEEIDEETVRYYYPLTVMGKYTNIAVQVTRPGTVPSNSVQITDIDFNLFSFGDGTEENPYRIGTATHLLNIELFPSANYVLTSSINLAAVDISERLTQIGAIISDEFNGVLDGAGFSILGFNIDTTSKTDTIILNDVTNFALFGTLNDATIKNLTIGSENIQLILLNMFANDASNVINLSLIATGANNSIIDNVDVLNLKVQLATNSNVTLSKDVYIAGLVNNATNSTLTNSTINFTVEVNIGYTGNLYVGGAISKANNSNLTNSKITFILSSSNDNTMLYVGGAIAYFEGNTAKTTGISGTNVNVLITNVKTIYFGGLVGFARYINIAGSSTEGTYTKTNINYQVYLGGLVGTAQSSTIQNSGSTIEFNISVLSTTDKYIGAIAGNLTIINNISGDVSNCYMNTTYQEKTSVTTSSVTLGIYGFKDPAVTIAGCYKLEN